MRCADHVNFCLPVRAFFLIVCLVLLTVSCAKSPQVEKIVQLKPQGVKQPKQPSSQSQFERWQFLVQENMDASIDQKLLSVNEFFNSLDHVEDRYLWGREDYWATLPETLTKSGGDCEDVAIAKYFTLLDLNIPEESLRITYVISLKTKKPHMVLAFSSNFSQDPIVLDTMNNYLFPASRRVDLLPVYSFNTKGYWLARKQNGWKGERLGSAAKLSRWVNLLERMKADEMPISDS